MLYISTCKYLWSLSSDLVLALDEIGVCVCIDIPFIIVLMRRLLIKSKRSLDTFSELNYLNFVKHKIMGKKTFLFLSSFINGMCI